MAIYNLNHGVYYTKGFLRGVLMDTNTGNTFSINEQACEVIENNIKDDAYWKTLSSLGLAIISKNSVKPALLESNFENKLNFVWFEVVSDRCNHHCVHCYADSSPLLCNKQKGAIRSTLQSMDIHKNKMSFVNWVNVIRASYELGSRSCQFIGGEPLLFKGENNESIFDLISIAKKQGFEAIELFTNATLLNLEDIKKIKDLDVSIATSLYSHDPIIHDKITNSLGSHNRLTRVLELLRLNNIKTRVEIVLMSINQESIENTIKYRDNLGFQGRKPDPLRPSGRGDNLSLQPSPEFYVKYGLQIEPNFRSSLHKLLRARSGNPCLMGKIAITENGDVLPCIFSRNQKVGNFIETKSLEKIVHSELLQNIWHLTKENVLVCSDCEYRYLCSDCRPLSYASNGNSSYEHAPYPRCTYNPYSGLWGDGVWRVDLHGFPYYDKSLEFFIHEHRDKTRTDH